MAEPRDLDRIAALLPAPADPVEAPITDRWGDLEIQLGLAFPSDYKRFLERYGSGIVDGFLWVLNPFSRNDALRFPEASERQLAILRSVREEGTERIPYPIYPEPAGLMVWAETANGDCCYWRATDLAPDDWQVCINEARAPTWLDHPGPATAFLADLLDGTVAVSFFPTNFPAARQSFAAI